MGVIPGYGIMKEEIMINGMFYLEMQCMCDGVVSSNEPIYVNSLTFKDFKGSFMVVNTSYGDV